MSPEPTPALCRTREQQAALGQQLHRARGEEAGGRISGSGREDASTRAGGKGELLAHR